MIAKQELSGSAHLFAVVCAAVVASACADSGGGESDGAPVAVLPADSAAAREAVPGRAGPPSLPSEPVGGEDLHNARSILEAYYAAIGEGDFERAYLLWADSGRASGQAPAAFEEGYAETLSVDLVAGQGRLEGAAGSRYAEFSVQVAATTRNGAAQQFEGTYVLRRSVVDGASADQRAWRIYSADIRRTR